MEVNVIVRRISKEEAKDILAKDRAALEKRRTKRWGVVPDDNTVIPGGKRDNPIIK